MLWGGVNQDWEIQEGQMFISIWCKSCQGPEDPEHWVTHLVAGGCPSWAVDHTVCTQSAAVFFYGKRRASVRCDKASVTNPVQSGGKSLLSNNTSSSLALTSSLAECLMQRTSALSSAQLSLWKSFLPGPQGTERVNLAMSRFSSDASPTQHQFDTDFFGGIWVNLSGRAVHLTDGNRSGIHRYTSHVSPRLALSLDEKFKRAIKFKKSNLMFTGPHR